MPYRPGKPTHHARLKESKHWPNLKRPVFLANKSAVIITERYQTPVGRRGMKMNGRSEGKAERVTQASDANLAMLRYFGG